MPQEPTDPRTVAELAVELGRLDSESRALALAVTKLYREAHRRRGDVAPEDVALAREAVRDTGRARQIIEGLVRRWAP